MTHQASNPPSSAAAESPVTLPSLDAMDAATACQHLERCCGSRRWQEEMLQRRPFASPESFLQAAEDAADALERDDWLEAFTHHPRIGDVDRLRQRFATTAAWSEGEQASVAAADEEVLGALLRGNQAYEARYGYIFIVCASGKSAAEMLALLAARLDNDPDYELTLAAAEQRKITALRLAKLISPEDPE